MVVMDQPHSLFRDLQLVRVCGVEMCVVRVYGEGVWCGDVWVEMCMVRVCGMEMHEVRVWDVEMVW